MRKLFLAIGLTAAVLFAFSAAEARADHGHHGHGHHGHGHHGHVDYGHYGHHHYGPAVVGWYAPSYQIAPRYVYRPYPAYSAYSYQPYYYSYPSSSLYIGGRNFSFGLSGF